MTTNKQLTAEVQSGEQYNYIVDTMVADGRLTLFSGTAHAGRDR